ncbi:hypothetical protein R3P38DRAFT_793458 [Favolaschia claudopus]|uniref:Uncharacterized protein n=1 Tax=Favolaschia claudopus TaxID=2862362 RepID=A0AAW0C3J9_9AGAR
MLWAASPSLVSPSSVIGARHPPHRRPALLAARPCLFSTFAAPAAARYRRWLVASGWGPGHRSHWAYSPSFVLPSLAQPTFCISGIDAHGSLCFWPRLYFFGLDSHRKGRGVRQGARTGTLGSAYHGTRFLRSSTRHGPRGRTRHDRGDVLLAFLWADSHLVILFSFSPWRRGGVGRFGLGLRVDCFSSSFVVCSFSVFRGRSLYPNIPFRVWTLISE